MDTNIRAGVFVIAGVSCVLAETGQVAVLGGVLIAIGVAFWGLVKLKSMVDAVQKPVEPKAE